MAAQSTGAKTFKKGEVIFKEGERVQNLFLVQSGQVHLQIIRGKPIDLFSIGANQILGDYILTGQATHLYTAVAGTGLKLLELPVEAVKQQLDQASQTLKLMMKSSFDRLKQLQNEVKSVRMERDSQPFPPDQLAKIFATIYHVAKYKGELGKDGSLTVSWLLMKQYAQRLFLEPPKRLEMGIRVLERLGHASFEMEKNELDPEAPDDISKIIFTNIELAEWVSEHWQYYYFKGSKEEFLKTDKRTMQVVAAMVAYASDVEPDRDGSVRLEFSSLVEKFRSESGIVLKPDFFSALEGRGLMVKRLSTDNGILIQFEIKEFSRWLSIWQILKEVEYCNTKGALDDGPVFDPRIFQKDLDGLQCSECGHAYTGSPKFCSECGAKIAAQEAA